MGAICDICKRWDDKPDVPDDATVLFHYCDECLNDETYDKYEHEIIKDYQGRDVRILKFPLQQKVVSGSGRKDEDDG